MVAWAEFCKPLQNEAPKADIDDAMAEANGDAREAIRNLLHDLATLALDANTSVSRGYVRGRLLLFGSRRASGK
jgi:hypothetical protein